MDQVKSNGRLPLSDCSSRVKCMKGYVDCRLSDRKMMCEVVEIYKGKGGEESVLIVCKCHLELYKGVELGSRQIFRNKSVDRSFCPLCQVHAICIGKFSIDSLPCFILSCVHLMSSRDFTRNQHHQH